MLCFIPPILAAAKIPLTWTWTMKRSKKGLTLPETHNLTQHAVSSSFFSAPWSHLPAFWMKRVEAKNKKETLHKQ